MATTTPDNLPYPDLGFAPNPVADIQNLANATQTALNLRGNAYKGTAAARLAFAAPTGTLWQDTDGGLGMYTRISGSWILSGEKGYAGTSTERAAFTNAPEGSAWSDTNGPRTQWVRVGTAWHYAPGELIMEDQYAGGNISSFNTGYAKSTAALPSGQKFRLEWGAVPGFNATGSYGWIQASLRYRKDSVSVTYNTGIEVMSPGGVTYPSSKIITLPGATTHDQVSGAQSVSMGVFFKDAITTPAALAPGFWLRVYGA
jgi:hypothetical protein